MIGTDEIKVAFIYQPASVSLVNNYAVLTTAVDPRFVDTRNRPAVAQTFVDDTTGGVFTVAVNHLKSKGTACPEDPDAGDGQGNCSDVRTAAAEALVDWLATDPTGSGSPDFLIIGDLNSYDKEDPIDSILEGADDLTGTADDYVDLVRHFSGELAYSYVFDGKIGYLDHGLANTALFDDVTGAGDWHINADEPDILDYLMGFKPPEQDAIYAPDQFRSSDHDAVLIGLDVCDAIAPEISVALDTTVLWPPRHQYVTVNATVAATDNFDPSVDVELVSVTSSEPDDGVDDGNTVNDIVVTDDDTFELRAERSGVGTGRVYTVTYRATDDCGNQSTATATVVVPLNQD